MTVTLKLTERSKKEVKANRELIDTWIKGLRSGKYTQIQESMIDENIPNSSCCLMVMEMVCNGRGWEEGAGYELPTDLWDAVEWPEALSACLADDVEMIEFTPSEWNDEFNASFEEIAELLDKGEVVVKNAPLHWVSDLEDL